MPPEEERDFMKIRVYYEDTDCGNVVYYANYLKYMERSRTELFREKGINLSLLQKKGYLFSSLGKSTSTRGGRSKRLYRLTPLGRKALIQTKSLEQSIWDNISLNFLIVLECHWH